MTTCPHCSQSHPGEVVCPTTGQPIARAIQPADALVGSILEGKYQIESKLGEGGMGAVYVGEHLLMKRRVAIKTLLPRFTTNANAVQRFQREAQAASAIGHPNIVTIHDLGQTPDGMLYIVMELLDGRDLAQELSQLREQGVPLMAPERARHIMLQVAQGLVAAHEKGVVHRDLKPDNIFLLNHREGPDQVRLLDFGISKIRTPTDEQARLTADGSLLGTPYYMSPEQAQGLSDIDHRVDIYAFGVILFELLTGRVPFLDDNIIRVIAMHAYEAPPLPRQLNPNIDPAMEAFVLQVMAKDPRFRYQTMADARDALAQIGGATNGQLPSFSGLTPSSGTASGYRQVGYPALPGSGTGSSPGAGTFPTPPVGALAGPMPPPGAITPTPMQVTPMQVTHDSMAPRGGLNRWVLAAAAVVVLAVFAGLGVAFYLGVFSGDEGPVARAVQTGRTASSGVVPSGSPRAAQSGLPSSGSVPEVPGSDPPVAAVVKADGGATPAGETEQGLAGASSASVRLEVVSEPSGAQVYRDGKLLGRTPLVQEVVRQNEEIEFVLKVGGYRDYSLRFVPEADGMHRAVLRRSRRRSSTSKSQPTRETGQPSGNKGLLKKMPSF